MQLKPIKTDADHEAALKEIERLWAPRKAPRTETAWRFSSRWQKPMKRSISPDDMSRPD